MVKKTTIIIFLILLVISGEGQSDCLKRIISFNYNLSICIKGKYYVDSTSTEQLIIGNPDTGGVIEIRKKLINIDSTSKELWSQFYKGEYNGIRWLLRLEKNISRNHVDIYYAIYDYNYQKTGTGSNVSAATGIIKHNNNIYQLYCYYGGPWSTKEVTESFLQDIIKNLRFLDEL